MFKYHVLYRYFLKQNINNNIGLCITLQTRAIVVMLPSDGLVVLYARSRNYRIGTVKLIFDLSFVLIAVLVSLWQSDMSEITGVREGSITGSVITGPVVQQLMPHFAFLDRFFSPDQDH